MVEPPRLDASHFFEAVASRYDRVYALSPSDSRRRMVRVLQALPRPPGRVLDLGIGTGRELTALLDAGYAPTGVDASTAMLARCARRARPVPLIQADFWCPSGPLPFDDSSFDAAIALHGTLAHPPDPGALQRLACELARIVRPGGSFVAEAPAPAWLEGVTSLPARVDCRIVRTGPRSCIYEDLVVGASIEATVLNAVEWEAAFTPHWRTRVEPVDEVEWLVTSRRV